jgi:hypothetical protein
MDAKSTSKATGSRPRKPVASISVFSLFGRIDALFIARLGNRPKPSRRVWRRRFHLFSFLWGAVLGE